MPISEFLRNIRQKVGHVPLLLPAVTAVVVQERDRVLLMQSKDNGQWYLPGGATDPGEQPADAVVREVEEETGVIVEPTRIIGVYADPISRYSNGDAVWYVSTLFACDIVGGAAKVNDDEAMDVRFFPLQSLPEMFTPHRLRIEQAMKGIERAQFLRG